MFRSRHEHTIDAKGRTSLPARWRDALAAVGERRIMLTTALDGCLNAYAMPKWLEFEEKLTKLSRFEKSAVQVRRLYLSGATECEIDDSGRILIPPPLRAHANLSKDVEWAGLVDYAELWDRKTWVEHSTIAADQKDAVSARLAELGL